MAQSLSTSQVGLAVPQDDMELGSDVERGPDLVIDVDYEIDVDVDLTNDPLEVQDNDYILEDVRSDAEHRSDWPANQVDDDLMQDEERDGFSMADDATILDAENQDVDFAQDLDSGVSLNLPPEDLAQANTTEEYPAEMPSQSIPETAQGLVRNRPTINHPIEGTQDQTSLHSHTGHTQETCPADEEDSTSKDNLQSIRPSSETEQGHSTSVVNEPGINSSLLSAIGNDEQAADFSENAQFEDLDYDEDPYYEDYTSPPHGHTSNLHPITVLYQETEMSLFPPTVNNATETYFLQDESLADSNISEVFKAMRVVLGHTISTDDELELGMDALDLYLTEGSIYAQQTTISQILDLYVKLVQNDGVQNPDPLYIVLTVRASCAKRLKELSAAVEEGKGISQLSLWDDNNYNTNNDQPNINDDDEATAVRQPQEDSALENTFDEEAGDVEYTQEGITEADGIDYSAKDEDDSLAFASGNPVEAQAEPERLVSTSSQHSTSDQGVPLNLTLPETSTETHLGENVAYVALPVEQVKDEARPARPDRPAEDEDLISYEEDEEVPTGQSDVNGLSTQTGDNYDDHDDVAKTSLKGESISGQDSVTDPAREQASNETAIDLTEDLPTTTGNVVPQLNHDEFDTEYQYQDLLAEEGLEDGPLVDKVGVQVSANDTDLTSHQLHSKNVENIGDGISKEHGLQDEISYDDGSEIPQPVNYEDQDELEIDYNWQEGDDDYIDYNTVPYTEEGEKTLTIQTQLATTSSATSWVGPGARSEDSATEAGDVIAEVQNDQSNTENATSSHNVLGKGLQSDDQSSCSSTKRSRVDNDDREPQQAHGQAPKRVRSK